MRYSLRRQGFAVIVKFRSFGERSIAKGRRFMGAARRWFLVTELAPHRFPIADRPSKGVPLGTKTITMYVSDLDQSEIPAGKVYQLSIRHPDGATQQLDISEKNYRALKLQGVGKTLKKRGRKPGATTAASGARRTRRSRQNSGPPANA